MTTYFILSVWSKWNRPPNALFPFAAPDKGGGNGHGSGF